MRHLTSLEVSLPIHKEASRVEWSADDAVKAGHIRQAVDLHNIAMTMRGIADSVARAHTAIAMAGY